MGHASAQSPQVMQALVISYCPSPSTIAETGQTSAQIPQLTHSEVIIYFMQAP
ncbi:MAG: hypothetical protein PWQ09_1017 [Candidatus Cloacimonadota bacterium]|nr:hypothetical protein [Candidatus Cloacimonadota bacterium]